MITYIRDFCSIRFFYFFSHDTPITAGCRSDNKRISYRTSIKLLLSPNKLLEVGYFKNPDDHDDRRISASVPDGLEPVADRTVVLPTILKYEKI